jgi:hypothetical protein
MAVVALAQLTITDRPAKQPSRLVTDGPVFERAEELVRSMHVASRRGRSRFGWAGLASATLVAAMLAAGCGGGSSGQPLASLGPTTTAGASPGTQPISRASVLIHALAFAQCMRTHGEPNFPAPTKKGGSIQETITPGSGVDPNAPQFTAARNACKHLLPNDGVPGPSPGQTFTPREQADYLKAAQCMRSHGVPDFPDPSFQGKSVAFNSQTPIDTNTPQYTSALTACQKLIPPGLPYGSPSG